jgi:uncharacterized OB-fold protein
MTTAHVDSGDAVRVLPDHFWAGDRELAPEVGQRVQLRGAACTRCKWACFPFQVRCAACGAATEEHGYGPAGHVVGSTYVRHTPPDSELAAPYGIAEVELDGGIVVFGAVLETEGMLEHGIAMHTVATLVGDGILTYAFRVGQ